MGKVLSRFRKKPSTKETLEKIEKDISVIREYKLNTQQRQKKIVGLFILYSTITYAVIALTFYLYYFPSTFKEQLFYFTPFLVFPIVVWLCKKFLTYYYQRKIHKNEDKLVALKEKKKTILDEVMEKETYKVAKEILEKYDPEQLRHNVLTASLTKKSALSKQPPASGTAGAYAEALSSKTTTTIISSKPVSHHSVPTFSQPGQMELRRRYVASTSSAPSVAGKPSEPAAAGRLPVSNPLLATHTNGKSAIQTCPPGPPMPRPILPRERSLTDKMIEYLVGDGPNNRYAMICRQCESHNGMALKEEFEYLAFRCCYCHYWNPARKQRPQAPRLPSGRPDLGDGGDSSSSEEDESEESGTGSEEESGSQSTSVSAPSAAQEDKSGPVEEDVPDALVSLEQTEIESDEATKVAEDVQEAELDSQPKSQEAGSEVEEKQSQDTLGDGSK